MKSSSAYTLIQSIRTLKSCVVAREIRTSEAFTLLTEARSNLSHFSENINDRTPMGQSAFGQSPAVEIVPNRLFSEGTDILIKRFLFGACSVYRRLGVKTERSGDPHRESKPSAHAPAPHARHDRSMARSCLVARMIFEEKCYVVGRRVQRPI